MSALLFLSHSLSLCPLLPSTLLLDIRPPSLPPSLAPLPPFPSSSLPSPPFLPPPFQPPSLPPSISSYPLTFHAKGQRAVQCHFLRLLQIRRHPREHSLNVVACFPLVRGQPREAWPNEMCPKWPLSILTAAPAVPGKRVRLPKALAKVRLLQA